MEKKAFICVGLSNGDEGKGQVVASLALQYADTHTVVRFNGGAQAAHNVVTPDGRHHTFAQFGSATFVPGVRTYHTKDVMLAPTAMLNEAYHLDDLGITDALERTSIDSRALIISPYHRLLNQMKERARGANRHGSCGMGIGETMQDFVDCKEFLIRAADLKDEKIIREKLNMIAYDTYLKAKGSSEENGLYLDYKEITGIDKDFVERFVLGCLMVADSASVVDGEAFEADLCRMSGTIIFEGSQGVLLDEWHGFHPYTTWSTTTTQYAEEMLFQNGYDGKQKKIGILRPYATRHGAGPLPTESETLTNLILSEKHNQNGEWQGKFRFGHFDPIMSRYAIACCHGIDELAITHLDELEKMGLWQSAIEYELQNDMFSGSIQDLTYLPNDRDLDRRALLTKMLEGVSVEYDGIEAVSRDVLEIIEDELLVPISTRSWGPQMGESSRTVSQFSLA